MISKVQQSPISEEVSKLLEDLHKRANDPEWVEYHNRVDAQERELERQKTVETQMERLEKIREHIGRKAHARLEAHIRGSEPLMDTTAMRMVQSWSRSPDVPLLLLAGGVGAGKSTAAGWLWIEHGGEWCPATELSERYDPWMSERADGVKPLNLRIPLLVIDDLGRERKSDTRLVEALEHISNCRDDSRWLTLFTTNIPKNKLREYYGDRFTDRLNDCAKYVSVGQESLRDKTGGFR